MVTEKRGVVPVIGVVLMIILTILLASMFASGVTTFGDDLEWNFSEDDVVSLTESGAGATETDTVTTLAGNPWSGSRGDLVRISDTQAGATDVSYRVNFTIEPGSDTIGNSLNGVYLEVTTGSPDVFSSTEQADLDRVVVDEGSDGSVDQEITHDVDGWDVQNGGSALKIEFEGSAYTPEADDSIVVVFDNAENPDTAGEYELRAETSGDGNWHYGTVTITE